MGKYNIWIINVEVMLRPNNFHFPDASAVKYYLGIVGTNVYYSQVILEFPKDIPRNTFKGVETFESKNQPLN